VRLTAVRIIGLIVALMLAGDVAGAVVLVVPATSHGPQISKDILVPGPRVSKPAPLHASLLPVHAPLAPRRGIIPCGCPQPRNLEPYDPVHPSPIRFVFR
jgi:hypothetical protein